MKQTLLTVTLFILASFMAHAQDAIAAPELSIGTATVTQGGTASLDISLSGGTGSYAGVNAKIILPRGVTLTDISRGTLLDGFTTDYRSLSGETENAATLIAYAKTKTFDASDGVLLSLDLHTENDTTPGIYEIRFAETNMVPFVNSKYALSNEDGTISESSITTQSGTLTISSERCGEDDIDCDGLPDTWEQQIIDADPNDDMTTISDVLPEDDFDGDGFSNRVEYFSSTDPTDPADVPTPCPCDLNNDEEITVTDAIIALKILSGMEPGDDFTFTKEMDIGEDERVGMEEVFCILRHLSSF